MLLADGNESNDDIPRVVLYLAGLLHQLDSLLTSPQLPLGAPVLAQALGFRTIFMQTYTTVMNLWRCGGQVHQAAWDHEVGRLREALTAQLMATSYITTNIEEHVAGMVATMLTGGENGQAGRGTVNLFLFHDGALRVWEELPWGPEQVTSWGSCSLYLVRLEDGLVLAYAASIERLRIGQQGNRKESSAGRGFGGQEAGGRFWESCRLGERGLFGDWVPLSQDHCLHRGSDPVQTRAGDRSDRESGTFSGGGSLGRISVASWANMSSIVSQQATGSTAEKCWTAGVGNELAAAGISHAVRLIPEENYCTYIASGLGCTDTGNKRRYWLEDPSPNQTSSSLPASWYTGSSGCGSREKNIFVEALSGWCGFLSNGGAGLGCNLTTCHRCLTGIGNFGGAICQGGNISGGAFYGGSGGGGFFVGAQDGDGCLGSSLHKIGGLGGNGNVGGCQRCDGLSFFVNSGLISGDLGSRSLIGSGSLLGSGVSGDSENLGTGDGVSPSWTVLLSLKEKSRLLIEATYKNNAKLSATAEFPSTRGAANMKQDGQQNERVASKQFSGPTATIGR